MVNETFIMLLIVYVVAVNAADKARRLVLHSDTDVAMELNKLRTELNDQNTVTQNLNNELQSLTSEIASLKSVKIKQNSEIHNLTVTLTTKLAEKDSEIHNLSHTLTSKLAEKDSEFQNLSNMLTSKLAEKDTEIHTLKMDQQSAINNITSTVQSRSAGKNYYEYS